MILNRKKTRKCYIRDYRDCYIAKFKIENTDYEFRIFELWEKHYLLNLLYKDDSWKYERVFGTYDLKLCKEYASWYASWLKRMYSFINENNYTEV